MPNSSSSPVSPTSSALFPLVSTTQAQSRFEAPIRNPDAHHATNQYQQTVASSSHFHHPDYSFASATCDSSSYSVYHHHYRYPDVSARHCETAKAPRAFPARRNWQGTMTSGGGGGRVRCSDGRDSLIARSGSLGIRRRECGLHRCRYRRRLWGIGVSRGLERAG